MAVENNIISKEQSVNEQGKSKKLLTFSELSLIKKMIRTDINEKGEKIFVSQPISKTNLINCYSSNRTYKVKRNINNLQKKELINCDANEDILVNENGIKLYTKYKKINTISIPIILLLSVIIIALLICEIITHGMFLNTYSDGSDIYKFYLSTYKSISYSIDDEKEISKGNYSINGDIITLNDNATQFYKYKNAIFEKESESFASSPLEKKSKGKYSLTESYTFLGYTLTSKSLMELNEDSTFAWAINYGNDTITSRSGDYKIKNNVITLNVKYTISPDDGESDNQYTLYAVIKDDTIYPYAYIKK